VGVERRGEEYYVRNSRARLGVGRGGLLFSDFSNMQNENHEREK